MSCAACGGPLPGDSWGLTVCREDCLDAFVLALESRPAPAARREAVLA